MLERLKRLDNGLARGEAAVAALVLLAMIVVAASQALLRNLTNVHLGWANEMLAHMEGADSFLQKGTLWLAFLGASLATHDDRHIAIDVIPRISPPRVRLAMRSIVGLVAGTVSFYLGRVFWLTVLNNGKDRPFEYEVLGSHGAHHICEAAASTLAREHLARPDLFCGIRWVLDNLGAHVETPGAAAQLIVPVMFLAISIRLLAKGVGAAVDLAKGRIDEGARGGS